MNTQTRTMNWADLGIGLYDRLTERNAEITYDFDNFRMRIPSATGDETSYAEWNLNGKLTITTRDKVNAPK